MQPIHGEPHQGNILATSHGPVLIDFEAVCIGPIEWDLGCAPPGLVDAVPGVDADAVGVARHLNSVRVATWCWASTHPAMRHYGVEQLEAVRRAQRAQLTRRCLPSQNGWRNLNFWSLPVAVRASASRNSTRLGHL